MAPPLGCVGFFGRRSQGLLAFARTLGFVISPHSGLSEHAQSLIACVYWAKSDLFFFSVSVPISEIRGQIHLALHFRIGLQEKLNVCFCSQFLIREIRHSISFH
jgi:hypothetical protein